MEEQAAGRQDAAVALLDQALQQKPDFAEALCAGAYILQMRGHAEGALAFYERALTLKPGDAVAWFNRGGLLMAAGRPGDALQCLDRACALQPNNAGFHCNRGGALFDLGRLEEAVSACERAASLDPSLAKARLNLGNALMRLGRYHDAGEAYSGAIALQPDYALAYCGRGIVSKEMGHFDEAMRAFDRALALRPDSEEAHSNKGCLQLLLGDFASGWEGYEYRWTKGERPVPVSSARFDLAAPASIAGRKILVVNDHGLGDTIQFFRYVALLARAGAQVTFAGPRKMRRLLASAAAPIAWRDEDDLSGDFDAALAISSLPRACRTRLDNIPAASPYLYAELDRQALWRERLRGQGLKIGLCWRGNVDFRVDPRRSIPPEALTPLAGLEGVRLFGLQKGFRVNELPPELGRKLKNLGQEFDSGSDSFIDTAAMMMEMDLIVTCDTSIAHLAGALGRPVWVALRHIAEWRWLDKRTDSPWYPMMRLFRCERGDDWAELFARMAAEIRKARTRQ
jgi:tetratricopeptide (TPR) repeat protein